jgi:hypothetical protein
MARHLIVANSNDNRPLSTMPTVKPLLVTPDTLLLIMLKLFLKAHFHMALVVKDPKIADLCLSLGKPIAHESAGVMGILTLEDLLEGILQEEIHDETDKQGINLPHPVAKLRNSIDVNDTKSHHRGGSWPEVDRSSQVTSHLNTIEEGIGNSSSSIAVLSQVSNAKKNHME